jgi:hypothetical protein
VIQLEYAAIALLCASSTFIAIGIARYSHDYIVTRERVELILGHHRPQFQRSAHL